MSYKLQIFSITLCFKKTLKSGLFHFLRETASLLIYQISRKFPPCSFILTCSFIQGVPPKLSGVQMGIWPLKCVRFSNPIPVSENLDREKFSSAGTKACFLIIFFRNLRSKKRGQNHKKTGNGCPFFMILTTFFRS